MFALRDAHSCSRHCRYHRGCLARGRGIIPRKFCCVQPAMPRLPQRKAIQNPGDRQFRRNSTGRESIRPDGIGAFAPAKWDGKNGKSLIHADLFSLNTFTSRIKGAWVQAPRVFLRWFAVRYRRNHHSEWKQRPSTLGRDVNSDPHLLLESGRAGRGVVRRFFLPFIASGGNRRR
jgi:hypothetical protein